MNTLPHPDPDAHGPTLSFPRNRQHQEATVTIEIPERLHLKLYRLLLWSAPENVPHPTRRPTDDEHNELLRAIDPSGRG